MCKKPGEAAVRRGRIAVVRGCYLGELTSAVLRLGSLMGQDQKSAAQRQVTCFQQHEEGKERRPSLPKVSFSLLGLCTYLRAVQEKPKFVVQLSEQLEFKVGNSTGSI